VGVDNALIRFREGLLLVGLAAVALLMLGIYRRYRLGRPLIALRVVGIALVAGWLSARTATGPLLNPCSERSALTVGDYVCPTYGQLIYVSNWEPGYGFIVLELGALGLALAGLLLLVPSAAPKRRRRRIPAREAVVWL
jgi:hypothetical protein